MSPLADRPFFAMNGLGNEILVVDLRGEPARPAERDVRALAGHVRFDQLMTIEDAADGSDAATRIYNRDGSKAGACGNGARCVAWLLMRDSGKSEVFLDAPGGTVLHCAKSLLPDTVTVDMGMPRFAWDEIPLAAEVDDTAALDLQVESAGVLLHAPAALNVGNPHAVFFVDDVEAPDLAACGPLLERHAMFPDRANISLASVTGPDAITLKVWERGAGLTRACGTAACAAAVAAARSRRTGRKTTVTLPGGALFIEWRESDGHILMTGPAELEREGRLSADLFAGAA